MSLIVVFPFQNFVGIAVNILSSSLRKIITISNQSEGGMIKTFYPKKVLDLYIHIETLPKQMQIINNILGIVKMGLYKLRFNYIK